MFGLVAAAAPGLPAREVLRPRLAALGAAQARVGIEGLAVGARKFSAFAATDAEVEVVGAARRDEARALRFGRPPSPILKEIPNILMRSR